MLAGCHVHVTAVHTYCGMHALPVLCSMQDASVAPSHRSDYGDFFGDFFGSFFSWGDYGDDSDGNSTTDGGTTGDGSGSMSLWDWISYFFPNGNVPADFGLTANYYNTSCYAKSINVYGTCSNGTMSYNWIDLGGGMQTTIDLLQPDCTQECSSDSGQDVCVSG